MNKSLNDTDSRAESVQINLLREAGFVKRLEITNSLVKNTFQLSWKGFCERYPDMPLEQRKQAFIHLLYGFKKNPAP